MIGVITLLGVGLAGCNKGGGDSTSSGNYTPKKPAEAIPYNLAPGQDADLFPAAEGNTWVYSSKAVVNPGGAMNEGELTFKCVKVEQLPEGKLVKIDIVSKDPSKPEKTAWLITKDGIYQVAAGSQGSQFVPRQPVVPFPAQPGKEFSWEGTGLLPGLTNGKSTLTGTITGVVEAETEIGRFKALAVDTTQRWTIPAKDKQPETRGESHSTIYYAPKVGIVRFRQELGLSSGATAVQIITLKSKTLK